MPRTLFGIAAGIVAGFAAFFGLALLMLALANNDSIAYLDD